MTLSHTMLPSRSASPADPMCCSRFDLPVPVPGHGQIVIRVAYAGVNRPDVLQRMGSYAPPPSASPLPGLEASGHVVALGPRRRALGDRRCRLCVAAGWGYAEYVATPAAHALPVPDGLSLREAACLPETCFNRLVERRSAGGGCGREIGFWYMAALPDRHNSDPDCQCLGRACLCDCGV